MKWSEVDWVRKLSSRKFWAALAGFLTPLLISFRVPHDTIEQIELVVLAVGSLIAYMFAEAKADQAEHKPQQMINLSDLALYLSAATDKET